MDLSVSVKSCYFKPAQNSASRGRLNVGRVGKYCRRVGEDILTPPARINAAKINSFAAVIMLQISGRQVIDGIRIILNFAVILIKSVRVATNNGGE
ncbi:hypothetical protein SODG_007035 [Sodalis praecaptivus]